MVGLDVVLYSFLDLLFGCFVLGVVGVGFVIYGVFCIVRVWFVWM